MRENFSVEMKKEGQVLEEQRRIGKEAMSGTPQQKSTIPPSARLRPATLAPGSAPSSTSLPPKAAEQPVLAEAENDAHTLIEGAIEEIVDPMEDKGAPAIAGEATAIVQPGQ